MTQTVAIIDYGSGNLKSAGKACERAARDTGIDAEVIVTAEAKIVRRADRIVLPGVGAFADCRAGLDAVPGMIEAIEQRVLHDAVPFLGICVGMQLLAREGREKGVHPGLGWIEGSVVRLTPDDPNLKVPHIGWNTLNVLKPHPLLDNIADGPDGLHAYFVHSYHFEAASTASLYVTVEYGQQVTAAIGRDNIFGTQFHPEKSQALGLTLIGNFLRWAP